MNLINMIGVRSPSRIDIGNKLLMCIVSIGIGTVIGVFFDRTIGIFLIVISIGLGLVFFLRPIRLYFFFMLFFIFGEVSVGEYIVGQSLSNGFVALAALIILFYGLGFKQILRVVQTRQQRYLLFSLLGLFLFEAISAFVNASYWPLATRLSHISTLLFFMLVVRDKSSLRLGYYLGVIGIGLLGCLTILASLNINPLGFRAPISWGSTPWEAYFHRAIGLPNMQGGLHSIYILAFLPLAIVMFVTRSKSNMRFSALVGAAGTFLGASALLIASYRSGWVGLLASLFCLFLFHMRFLRLPKWKKLSIIIFCVCFVILIVSPFSESIYTEASNLVFNIRSQGVQARFIQSSFIMNKMLTPSLHLVFGYGYDDFGSTFINYVSQQGFNNPELYPWIHNYYFGLLYVSGWPSLLTFIIIIVFAMKSLYHRAASSDKEDRMLFSAVFSSLAGIVVVLLFTAQTSGLQIVWILLATSAFVNFTPPKNLQAK